MAVHCPVSDSTVLIWPSQLIGAANSPIGVEVAYRCHCGARAVVRTGKRAPGTAVIAHDGADLDPSPLSAPVEEREPGADLVVAPLVPSRAMRP